jgi:twitching motility protein PilT
VGTLHATGAQQAVQRLFEFFDPAEGLGRRRQIAASLRATITRKAFACRKWRTRPRDGGLPCGPARTARYRKNGEFEKNGSVVEAGKDVGSATFNSDLYRLIKAGVITKEEGLSLSEPEGAGDELKGIFLSQGGIVS